MLYIYTYIHIYITCTKKIFHFSMSHPSKGFSIVSKSSGKSISRM